MDRFVVVPALLLAGLAITLPTAAFAQIRASERGAVSQTVDGTTITIDYGRPQTRGRTNLFGGEVPWGKVWTPGANWATTLEVNRDITVDGHALAAGTYSVWLAVNEDTWTAIFDPQPRRFHLMPPPEAANQVRFGVTPTTAPHAEVLTWSFPSVRPTGATLQLAWSTTAISFDIGVAPSRPIEVAADFAERFVGSYRLQLMGALGDGQVGFEISYENDRLVAHWESPPVPRLGEVWLISLGAGMFAPAELMDGELFDIVMDLIFEFTPVDGRATGFELRALGDALWGAAERRP